MSTMEIYWADSWRSRSSSTARNPFSSRWAQFAVPHNIGDTITVDFDLVGTELTVNVDGAQVFDGALTTVATDPGGVGLGVITGATTVFDDFWVEALN